MTTNISEIVEQLPRYLQEQVPVYEETLRPNMYAGIAISVLLVYISVGLRLYGRRLQGMDLWWDDYTSILALIFTSVSAAVLLYVTYLGFGRHVIVLVLERPEQIGTYLRMVVASNALYFPSICFSKLSILFQYRRLFHSKKFKGVLITVGIASTIYCVISMSVLTALCLPIQVPTLEDPHVQPLACVDIEYMLLWICSFNAAFDLLILCLPIYYVWRLHTTFRRKVQLTILFLLGLFVVAISIFRTWYFTHLGFEDMTWTGSLGNLWTEIEGCMAIVAGCLPAMMPIFRGRGRGKTKPTYKSSENVNLVTFGSSGKKKSKDISVTMQTTVDATAVNEGNYRELIDQVGQQNQAMYYQGGGRW